MTSLPFDVITDAGGVSQRKTRAPWFIRILITDYDGTAVPTYKTLEELYQILTRFGKEMGRENAVAYYAALMREHMPIRHILHKPALAFPSIVSHLVAHEQSNGKIRAGGPINGAKKALDTILTNGIEAAHQSFKAFDGAVDVLKQARKNGTAIVVHTRTRAEMVVHRLALSDIEPDTIDYIFARVDNEQERAALPWKHSLKTEREKAFATKLIPYVGKKNHLQVNAILRLFEAHAHEVLYVGESVSDYRCINNDCGKRFGFFAYQEQGARLSEEILTMNGLLRDHPLGHEHVEKTVPQLRNDPNVLILKNGWTSLQDEIARGTVVFQDLLAGRTFLPRYEEKRLQALAPAPL